MRLSYYKVSISIFMLLTASVAKGFFVKSYGKSYQRKRAAESANLGPKLFFKKSSLPDEKTIVNLHDSVTLTCEAAGVPPPTIHWLYYGERIEQSVNEQYEDSATFEDRIGKAGQPLLRMSTSRAELIISCADKYTEGRYSCIAQTPYQRIYASTLLQINKDSESLNTNECSSTSSTRELAPPHIYMWSKNRLEFEGATVQLFCRAEGSPKPVVTWFDRDGEKIQENDDEYKVLDNGDLLVKDIGWKRNMGRFACRANNILGEDVTTTFLYPTNP